MKYDIICFSHLRWNFVFQRPQHLLTRFSSGGHRVFYMEEPVRTTKISYNEINEDESGVVVITPYLQDSFGREDELLALQFLLDDFIKLYTINSFIRWYYSPMAIEFSKHLRGLITVYDCMDELTAFKFAPESLASNERTLMQQADLMFTGGFSLYEAKKYLHNNIYAFPSSIDKDHFYSARKVDSDPEDQQHIPHPRLGFYGVIDERFNLDLLKEMADLRPDLHFILLGPVVKIDPTSIPSNTNIHCLGARSYKELPFYLSGWDIAMMPFALNESTRFISPTKTPEYLAGGKPVISTSIQDVVNSYGNTGLVHIADTAGDFIEAANKILNQEDKTNWLKEVDECLNEMSWDKTWENMTSLIGKAMEQKNIVNAENTKEYV